MKRIILRVALTAFSFFLPFASFSDSFVRVASPEEMPESGVYVFQVANKPLTFVTPNSDGDFDMALRSDLEIVDGRFVIEDEDVSLFRISRHDSDSWTIEVLNGDKTGYLEFSGTSAISFSENPATFVNISFLPFVSGITDVCNMSPESDSERALRINSNNRVNNRLRWYDIESSTIIQPIIYLREDVAGAEPVEADMEVLMPEGFADSSSENYGRIEEGAELRLKPVAEDTDLRALTMSVAVNESNGKPLGEDFYNIKTSEDGISLTVFKAGRYTVAFEWKDADGNTVAFARQKMEVYPSVTESFGDTEDCIRVNAYHCTFDINSGTVSIYDDFPYLIFHLPEDTGLTVEGNVHLIEEEPTRVPELRNKIAVEPEWRTIVYQSGDKIGMSPDGSEFNLLVTRNGVTSPRHTIRYKANNIQVNVTEPAPDTDTYRYYDLQGRPLPTSPSAGTPYIRIPAHSSSATHPEK